eukprot:1177428-Prorocentrum_minimum.AAC.5
MWRTFAVSARVRVTYSTNIPEATSTIAQTRILQTVVSMLVDVASGILVEYVTRDETTNVDHMIT